ncbi:hypothetical protein COU78_02945 [Candidatus Peregrinibacteria bacterium CG10_big_fil_rev_8_21_14_0_10_49_24]|nr:MAG: hypothetical protein COV83_06780 [Candidatus Peregrinibacteria bacterium CG11_big_fil_rev_8_21_14_0_20_49_14]PIR51086.1 MAG: hypothetical protein COU78_02945 [Candidatus Peregrinibacteria bacterium CG10_big_fil_rev_8_21_14_0_10_49_24]PJA67639.1 MAG: hypothetical protein CO157_04425 [Candidatus Peregrinibacteria bacterium CG_4_9_14_3_um_filter_49_12]
MPKVSVTSDAKQDVKLLSEKPKAKAMLQKELGWPMESKRPMICIPTGMTKALGGKLFEQLLPGLLSIQTEVLILGRGSSSYGSFITGLAQEQNHRIAIIQDNPVSIEKMYKAADMVLFLSDPASLPELKQSLENAAIPIAPQTKALENYNPVQESGNAFLYETEDAWQCFAAIVRAMETHVFPYDWKTIQKHCLES